MTGQAPTPDQLPEIIPVFPLTGMLLLPGGQMPLNIFEPRYLAMVREALGEEQRLIGMVQPRVPDFDDNRGPAPGADPDNPEIYRTGCAGCITGFNETEDGRYLIVLTGRMRFEIAEEVAMKDGFRRVRADYSRYTSDLLPPDEPDIDRERLLKTVKAYFEANSIGAEWSAVEKSSTDRLVTSLAMSCPFSPGERQGLLEAPTLAARAEMMLTLLDMALVETGTASGTSH